MLVQKDRWVKFYINGKLKQTGKIAIPASKFPIDWELSSADGSGWLRGPYKPSSLVRFLPGFQYLLEPASGVWMLGCGVLTSRAA